MKKCNRYTLIFICFLFMILIDILFITKHRIEEKNELYKLEILKKQNYSLKLELKNPR